MNTPKVAVLLAAYNGVKWLPEQVTSILCQTNVGVKVFISVDKSQDGTEEWVSAFTRANNSIKLLPCGYEFGGAAANFYWLIKSVDLTDFDYIAFADQDDVWFPNKLCRAIRTLEDNACHAYSSNVIAFWPDGRKSLIDKAQSQREMDYLFEAAGPGCTYVLKKSLGNDLQEFVIRNWSLVEKIKLHDWLFYAYARAHDYRWFIDPEPTLLYRQHESNQLGANIGFYAAFRRVCSIVSGEWILQAKSIAEITSHEGKNLSFLFGKLEKDKMFSFMVNSFRYRRRFRDQVFFSLAFLFFLLYKPKKLRNINDQFK